MPWHARRFALEVRPAARPGDVIGATNGVRDPRKEDRDQAGASRWVA
jgi:hypothetical protein